MAILLMLLGELFFSGWGYQVFGQDTDTPVGATHPTEGQDHEKQQKQDLKSTETSQFRPHPADA
jgi:hypothetical protein